MCIGRILETELQIVGPDMLLDEVTLLHDADLINVL